MLNIASGLFLTGLLFGSGPCLASCGPILLSYIVATGKDIPKGLKDYLLFSLARLLAYLVLILAVFFLGSYTLQRLMGDYTRYLFALGGVFIVFVGLMMMLRIRLELPFLQRLQKNMMSRPKQNLLLIGLIIGLLPCAPLLAVFSYIGLMSKTWLQSMLFVLSFGLGTLLSPLIPLVIIAGFIPSLLGSRKPLYERLLCFIGGFIILLFGLQLIVRGFIK
ncbi:MAG: sulfite exporter TauE/SafE family protein [Candidatus Omnitrophota bacterium]